LISTTIPGITLPAIQGPISFPNFAPSTKQNGWLFGGFFGAQKQWGNWVLGIEGDIDGADIKGSGVSTSPSVTPPQLSFPVPTGGPIIVVNLNCPPDCVTLNQNVSIDSKTDMLASLRGKVGWSFAPNWLIYGTGGAAFAHVENTVASTQSVVVSPGLAGAVIVTPVNTFAFTPGGTQLHSASGGATMFGWAAGAGVDWKHPLDAGSALVFGVAYLHYGFPEQTLTLSDNAGGSLAFKAKEHVDAVKGRISYLFSIH
jgi:outer membrane immunogenic protein